VIFFQADLKFNKLQASSPKTQLSGRYHVKLIDYGRARLCSDPGTGQPPYGEELIGSIYSMSPEFMKEEPLDLNSGAARTTPAARSPSPPSSTHSSQTCINADSGQHYLHTMKPCMTDKDQLMKIEDQLCFALYSASRAITKKYAELLDPLGLTYPQYMALMALWTRDGLLIQELAVTPLIQRLEKLEFVSRERSSEDERRVHVFLTTKGKRLYQKAKTIPVEARCAVGVTETRAKKLIAEAKKIKSHLS